MDSKLLSDAASRNALFKIHVALGKIVNALGEQQDRRASRATSASTSVLGEERTIVDRTVVDRSVVEEGTVVEDSTVVRGEPSIKEEEGSDGTVVPAEEGGDSLVEDLLSDEEA